MLTICQQFVRKFDNKLTAANNKKKVCSSKNKKKIFKYKLGIKSGFFACKAKHKAIYTLSNNILKIYFFHAMAECCISTVIAYSQMIVNSFLSFTSKISKIKKRIIKK